MYNYYEEVKKDVIDWINWNYDGETVEQLDECLWIDDSVTGNGSGSYTFNRETAKEYVLDNLDLLKEAYFEFGYDYDEIGRIILNEEWEACDVTIRCSLLGQVIDEVFDELGLEAE